MTIWQGQQGAAGSACQRLLAAWLVVLSLLVNLAAPILPRMVPALPFDDAQICLAHPASPEQAPAQALQHLCPLCVLLCHHGAVAPAEQRVLAQALERLRLVPPPRDSGNRQPLPARPQSARGPPFLV